MQCVFSAESDVEILGWEGAALVLYDETFAKEGENFRSCREGNESRYGWSVGLDTAGVL